MFGPGTSFFALRPAGCSRSASERSRRRVPARRRRHADLHRRGVSGGAGPAHVAVDRSGAFVLVANYGSGDVAISPIQPDGGLAASSQIVHAGANAHGIVTDPSNRYVFVPCLGDDRVVQYRFDATTGQLTPNGALATAVGAGPRHLAFAPDGTHAYLIDEKASTVMALSLDFATGQLATLQTISTRAAGATGTNATAEIVVHPSGKWLYGSNRGDDNLVQLAIDSASGRLTLVGHTSAGGAKPRSFTLNPTGAHLYAANQSTNNIVTFTIDPATGTPAPTGATVDLPTPAFIEIVPLAP